ncbi:thioredoxin family protein [Glycocaulis abyssi]|uniref:Thioredoxin family protein n=1 Tax=Glycocaulis abyssi TaxID=1433403 RepID=A0ABV9NB39_9PROT
MRPATIIISLVSAFSLLACAPEPEEIALSDLEITAVDEPYSAEADAHGALDAAYERAAERGTRVLVKFGGNWCPDCRIFAGMLELAPVRAYADAHYEIVAVDVGRYERNMDVVARFGLEELEGVPTVIITTAEGEIINTGTSAEWRTARERSAQDVLDYLTLYAEAEVPEGAARAEISRP